MVTTYVGARIKEGRVQLSKNRGIPRLAFTTEDKAVLVKQIEGRFHLYSVDVDSLVLEAGDIMCKFPGPEEVTLSEVQVKQIMDATAAVDDG